MAIFNLARQQELDIMEELSDEEVPLASRSLKNGTEAQRSAIEEARSRGIFDWNAHLAASPIGQAMAARFPYKNIRPFLWSSNKSPHFLNVS